MAIRNAIYDQLMDLASRGVRIRDAINAGFTSERISQDERNQIGQRLLGTDRSPTTVAQGNPYTHPVNPRYHYSPPSYLRASTSWPGSGTSGSSDLPKLDLADYDLERVEALGQRAAAPGLRRLRSEIQNVQQGYYENPNVKAMTMRQALQGYGQGLENVMAGAYKEGRAQYGEERKIGDVEAMSNWEAQLRRSMMRYQTDLQKELQDNQNNDWWRRYQATHPYNPYD